MVETNKGYTKTKAPRKDPGQAAPLEATSRTHGWPVEEHKGVTDGGEAEGAAPNDQG